MPTALRRLALALALVFIAYAGLSLVATVSQLADAADRVHMGLGQWVFWSLLTGLSALVLWPVALVARMPRPLQAPPADSGAAAQQAYQDRLRAHLGRNPLLAGQPLETEADLAAALQLLADAAEAEVRRTAGVVFAGTALLQNGRLDGLVLLAQQLRLVWRVARIYRLRPSLRQMAYLYGNVGACVLLASSVEELDFSELTAPIAQAATPSVLASVPGLGSVGQVLVGSLANGAANAFLTLRVGLIAQAYCAPLHAPDAAAVRGSASLRAAQLLGQIVKDCGSQVSQAVWDRVRHSVVRTAQGAVDGAKSAGQAVGQGARKATRAAVQGTGELFSQAGDQVRKAGRNTAQATQQAALSLQQGTQQALDQTAQRARQVLPATWRKDPADKA